MPQIRDIETYGTIDLASTGAAAYAAHPDTRVRAVQVADADNDEPPHVFVPELHGLGSAEHQESIRRWSRDGQTVGHNAAGFDRAFASHLRRLGYPVDGDPGAWVQDTMPRAIAAGHPAGLADLGVTLGLGGASKADGRVLRIFTRPDRDGAMVPLSGHARADEFLHYARQDIVATRSAHRQLPALDDFEQQVHAATLRMNDRGVRVDLDLCRGLVQAQQLLASRLLPEFEALTGLQPRQAVALRALFNRWGVPIDSVDEEAMRHVAAVGVGVPRRVAELKLAFGGAAVNKAAAALQRAVDGRLHGEFNYFGAITGRWSSRGVQLQNLPRPARGVHADDVVRAVELLRTGRAEELVATHPNPAAIVRSCVRGIAVGDLVVVDLSRIELLTLFAAAGCSHRLKGDAYVALASSLFKVPVERVTSEQRQAAKPVVLGCFEADTRVLTDRGVKRIVDVSAADKVWDGEEWVNHSGVIFRGEKWTTEISGVRATPDHLVLTAPGQWAAWAEVAASRHSLFQSALSLARSRSWATSAASVEEPTDPSTPCDCGAPAAPSSSLPKTTSCTGAPPGVPCAAAKGRYVLAWTPAVMRVWSQIVRTARGCWTASAQFVSGVSTTRITPGAASACTHRGRTIARRSWPTWSRSPAGTTGAWRLTASTTTRATSPATCDSFPEHATAPTAGQSTNCSSGSQTSKRRSRVYDLLLAGPRSRFTILTDDGPLIVHNCGYLLRGPGLQANLRKAGIEVSLEWATSAVAAYAATFPEVVQLWGDLEQSAAAALQSGQSQPAGRCGARFEVVGCDLHMVLPSGRHIPYRNAQARPGVRYGRTVVEITYDAPWVMRPKDGSTPHSGCQRLGASVLTENLASGMARDLLAHALVEADRIGLQPVATVHDEIICDVAAPGALGELVRAMTTPPPWAAAIGLQPSAEGWTGPRYRK